MNEKMINLTTLRRSIERLPKESTRCNICHSPRHELLSSKARYGFHVNNVVCTKCGLIYITPRMTERAYRIFYSRYYRSLYSGSNKPRESFFNEQVTVGKRIYGTLSKHRDSKGKSVLEIGCGAGGILYYFHEKGSRVTGVDYDEEYLAYGRSMGVRLLHGGIESVKGKYDIIILSHVLEHFLHPKEDLMQICKHLSKDGTIYISCPGFHNLKVYSYDTEDYFQNAHPYSFTLVTLKNLCKLCSLRMVYGDETIDFIAKKDEAAERAGANKQVKLVSDYANVLKSMELYKKKEKLIPVYHLVNHGAFIFAYLMHRSRLTEKILEWLKKIYF